MYQWCQKTCKPLIYDNLKTTYQYASQLSPIFPVKVSMPYFPYRLGWSEPGDEL